MRRTHIPLARAAAWLAVTALAFPAAAATAESSAKDAPPTPPPALSYGSAAQASAPKPARVASAAPAPRAEPATQHHRRHRHKADRSAVQTVLHDAEVRSTEQPRRPEFINSTLHYAFEPGKLYTIQTAPGFLTAIALRPGEHLVSKAAGDTVRWEVGETSQGSAAAPQVLILIKPLDTDLRTNMILTTDQRTYVLDLVSAAGSDHSTLVDWRYPAEEMHELQIKRAAFTVQALAAQAQTIAPSPFITPPGGQQQIGPARLPGPAAYNRPAMQPDVAPASLNFDYKIESKVRRAPGWTPEHVFDDGRKTYVKFPANISTIEIPPLFMIGPKGQAELINYRFENGYYIVDRLFSVAELRLGSTEQQVVRIVYKGGAR